VTIFGNNEVYNLIPLITTTMMVSEVFRDVDENQVIGLVFFGTLS